MTQLKNEYQARPATEDDIESLTDLINEYWEELSGVVKFSLDDLKNIFSIPGFDMESSIQVVLSPKNEIVACGLVIDLNNPPVHPGVYGCVRKGYEGRGLGTHIIQWAEERARQAIDRCPEGVRVAMHLQTAPSHDATVRLFENMECNRCATPGS